MGIFSSMATASPTGGSNYFAEGVYLGRVHLARMGESQQGKGTYVALEADILHTHVAYPAGRVCPINGQPRPASNTPGERCSNVVLLRQQPAMANLKGFLLAATGLDEAQIVAAHADAHGLDPAAPATAAAAWEALCLRAFGGEGDMLRGRVVVARVTVTKTRAGTPFTRVVWERPDEAILGAAKAAGVDLDA